MEVGLDGLCRLCMGKLECKYSLFNVAEKVEFLALLEIKEDDGLPTSCCEGCFSNIIKFYQFKQNILQSDRVLRNLISKDKDFDNESSGIFEVVRVDEEYDLKPKAQLYDPDQHIENYDDSINDLYSTENMESYDLENKQNMDQVQQNKTTLTCGICNKMFLNRRTMQNHAKGHMVAMCPICQTFISKTNISKHIKMHEGGNEICDICGKVAKNKESLRGHMNYVHKGDGKQATCEYCGKNFKHRNYYLAHVRTVHLGVRNQQCHLCGKTFSDGYGLKKHINMTHYRLRPHICKYCEKGFCTPYALKTHIRRHTQETPYCCEICNAAFRQKVSLDTHLKSKHSDVAPKENDKDHLCNKFIKFGIN